MRARRCFSSAAGAWRDAAAWAVVSMIVRGVWLQRFPPVAVWDGAIYHRTAVRIAAGLGFVDTWNNQPPFTPTAFYPVGYPASLGALYALLGAEPWVAGLLAVLAAAVCTAFTVRFAHLAWGRSSAHAAGALYALAPGPVIYSSAFMTEPLSAALLCAALWAAFRHARRGGGAAAVVCGVLLGVGGLVRPPALLVAPIVALLAAPSLHWNRAMRTVALVGVACCAVVLPWTARNCVQLDGCALVSVNGGSNLWIGADGTADGGYRDLRPGEGCDGSMGEVTKDRCYGALAVAKIRAHPLEWLALAPRKLRQLLAYETSPVSYLRAAHERLLPNDGRQLYGLMTAHHLAVLALALGALVPMRQRRSGSPTRLIALLVGTVTALVAIHVVFFGVDRYHFVFTPLLCALSSGVLRREDEPSLD